MNKSAIVVGAGIVGLATARALAEKGYAVKVIEKSQFALGASVRNFGMLWPVGQPDGNLYNRSVRTKEIWVDYSTKKKALKDVTSVTSSNVRGVNNRIRYVIEKELQSLSGIFSIDRYRIKAKSVDYKTVKN